MDEEIAYLKNNMDVDYEETIANCLFIKGQLQGKVIVLLKSGIGKVNAALATSILMERFNPDLVINTGSAGGLDTELEIGDVVIANEVVHHDVDVTAFNYQYGQVPGMPASYTAASTLMAVIERMIKEHKQVNCKQGIIATGDSFMTNPERVALVKERIPNVMAVEMEAAAIAQVCYQYDKPFAIIRSLSDIAGKQSSISFDAYLKQAARHAAELIIAVVNEL